MESILGEGTLAATNETLRSRKGDGAASTTTKVAVIWKAMKKEI